MNHYKVFIIFYMMTAVLLGSVILSSNLAYAITSQDSNTYNENYEKKENELSTRYLMTSLPNVDHVKSPFKDYEMMTTDEKEQIKYNNDYHNYKDNKYYYSDDDYYYQDQGKTDTITSSGLEHQKPEELSSDYEIESIVGGGKYCLQDRGFNPTIFQAPYNKGGDDPKIVDIISKYFDSGFTGHSELMFLNCDGYENFGYDKKSYLGTTDCRPYFSDGTTTPTNKYGMKEWSHDREHDSINDEYNDEDPQGEFISNKLFEKFVEIVESQKEFNQYREINAIPIIGYHEISTKKSSVSTSPELFEREMEYLYDNGFNVITLADLEYDDYQERFYIKDINNNNRYRW